MIPRIREFLLRLHRTLRPDHSADDELRFHLEMAEAAARRRGESLRDARLRAGSVAQASEALHDQRTLAWLRDFFQDTRYGIRLLARSPLFAVAAIGSLALGIGANTAIFSLIDAVMLRVMPVHQPERLLEFAKHSGQYGRGNFSHPLYQHFRRELRSFDGLLARASLGRREVSFGGEPELVNVEVVSSNYYAVLGITAFAGRTFDPDLDQHPAALAVLSHAFWQHRFAADPAVIGRTLRLNRTVFTVAGVGPPEFHGVVPGEAPDITFPLAFDGEVRGGDTWVPYESRGWLSVIGRISPGQSISHAQTEVSSIYAGILAAEAAHYPKELHRRQILSQRMLLQPAANGLDTLRERFSEPLRILMGIVALVLLIACANLANLLLGRASTRRREIAVRLAMGAGRGRVIRQLFAEGLLLSTAGGALGLLLACWSANALITVMSNGGQRIALEIRPDLRVLTFAAAVSVAACLLFSLAPAFEATRRALQPALAEARGSTRWRLGRVLISIQVAISIVLLIGAGLFGRTLYRLYSLETGFDRSSVLVFSLDTRHASLRGPALRDRVLQDLRSLPGVAAASVATSPVGLAGWDGSIRVEGYTPAPNEDDRVQFNAAAPDYFATLRTPVLLGREFNDRDTPTSLKVVVINDAFARRYFRDHSPLGKWVNIAGQPDRREIVGVVKDVRLRSSREGALPTLYLALTQAGSGAAGAFVVRGGIPEVIVHSALKRIDPNLRATDLRTLEEHLSRGVLQERIMGTLSAFFGALSLLLVSLGIYGVVAFQVARRRKEIGIRIALGARPRQVVAMILAESSVPVAFGVTAGIAGAAALTRVTQKMLYGVTPTDPITFTAACAILITLAFAAAWFPSRIAARLSPVDTLRCE
jgi:predicted permease